MDGSTSPKKESVLTQEAFDKLLACLDADRDRAGQKYERIRRKLVRFFQWRGSVLAEDHADETINRVARKVLAGEKIRAIDPLTYFYGVARNVLREQWGEQQTELGEMQDQPPFKDSSNEELEQRLKCLERCMEQELDADSQEMIIKYYQGEKPARIRSRRELAQGLGIGPNALRIRAHRIREKLEQCVNDCLKRLISE